MSPAMAPVAPRRSRGNAAFRNRAVPSPPAVARVLPSGLNVSLDRPERLGCTAAAARGYGTGVEGPGAAAPAAEVHGFPAALTSFVGREEVVRDVAGMLEQFRLVTVTGPGGMGKTRLAGQVARQVA